VDVLLENVMFSAEISPSVSNDNELIMMKDVSNVFSA
jgi:hypothetical protein